MSKLIKIIKIKTNKSNIIIISFLIFISIPIIIGVSIGTTRKWFDILSIISIFYIGISILVLIFTLDSNGFIKKIFSLFKFKEIKEINKKNFTTNELKKIKFFNSEEDIKKPKNSKNKSDIIFISIILIIYGLLLLIASIPSLIIFTVK